MVQVNSGQATGGFGAGLVSGAKIGASIGGGLVDRGLTAQSNRTTSQSNLATQGLNSQKQAEVERQNIIKTAQDLLTRSAVGLQNLSTQGAPGVNTDAAVTRHAQIMSNLQIASGQQPTPDANLNQAKALAFSQSPEDVATRARDIEKAKALGKTDAGTTALSNVIPTGGQTTSQKLAAIGQAPSAQQRPQKASLLNVFGDGPDKPPTEQVRATDTSRIDELLAAGTTVRPVETTTATGTPGELFGGSKKDIEIFRSFKNDTDIALNATQRIREQVGTSGTLVGFISGATQILDGLAGNLRQAANLAGNPVDESLFNPSNYDLSKIEAVAGRSSAVRSNIIDLAYILARAANPGGKITNLNIKNQIDRIGGSTGSKTQLLSNLDEVDRGLKSGLTIRFDNLAPDVKAGFEALTFPGSAQPTAQQTPAQLTINGAPHVQVGMSKGRPVFAPVGAENDPTKFVIGG